MQMFSLGSRNYSIPKFRMEIVFYFCRLTCRTRHQWNRAAFGVRWHLQQIAEAAAGVISGDDFAKPAERHGNCEQCSEAVRGN